jgi:leucyl aminopeptidase
MKLIAKKEEYRFKKSDTAALFITMEDVKKRSGLHGEKLPFISAKIDLTFFRGKEGETLFIPLLDEPNLIICGLGKTAETDRECLRRASSAVTGLCREKSIKDIDILLPEVEGMAEEDILLSLAQGASLSNYEFIRYKTPDAEAKISFVEKIGFLSSLKKAPALLKRTGIISRNALLCRDLVNDITEKATPLVIASEAKKLSKLKNVTCKVYGKKELEKMKMGLLLAVNRGSKIPPQLVVLKYTGNPGDKKSIALVGKGITFDSGGMNLKPSGYIETMRMDMAGAAAVLYTLKTAAELGLKKNIYGIMPLTENMLSNDSYRPGDVFRSYSGKTVEVGNTDAEGRLILADALAFTEDKLKPDCIIDMATLTGACIVAFGETVAGLLSNSDGLAETISGSAEATGEKVWRLPLFKDYEEPLKSDFADISNISSKKEAGTIAAATFLKNFVKSSCWAHIDIAGTAWYSSPRGYLPKNATGYGVRLLTEVIERWE